jgi:pimeloyl-ACP methyl ester carboxylesterase
MIGPTPADHVVIPLANLNSLLKQNGFDKSLKTVFYSFGWNEVFTGNSTQLVSKAHIARGGHNFIVIDWSAYSQGNYLNEVVPKIGNVAISIGTAIINLIKGGLSDTKIHLIGHSIGGQLSGFIGKYVQANSPYKIQRITGLDPAGPSFSTEFILMPYYTTQLNKTDARFVDVIHTDSFMGIPYSIGHVDFYPNGGKYQTGCPAASIFVIIEILLNTSDRCSHRRAWRFWSESVLNKRTFRAVRCKSWNDFKLDYCQYGITTYMGFDIPIATLRGDYYLQTNPTESYARDNLGIRYDYSIHF